MEPRVVAEARRIVSSGDRNAVVFAELVEQAVDEGWRGFIAVGFGEFDASVDGNKRRV